MPRASRRSLRIEGPAERAPGSRPSSGHSASLDSGLARPEQAPGWAAPARSAVGTPDGRSGGKSPQMMALRRHKLVQSWGVDDVSEWLAGFGLGSCAPAFAANEVDGFSLQLLSTEDIELLVPSERHRRIFVEALTALRASIDIV